MLRFFLIVSLLAGGTTAYAQQAPTNTARVASNAPADRPISVGENAPDATLNELDRRIAPAVKQARAMLPQAKKRFLAGLPAGQAFFLTTRVSDPNGLIEQVFVRVTQWQGTKVQGTIANELNVVRTYQPNQLITFSESAVLDWTISQPDGTEEGNFVGKLLDAGPH
jgi:hypothetical protein